MTDINTNLTQNGFDRPELNDVATYVKQLFKDKFGSSIDMDDTSTAGMFAGVLTTMGDRLNQVLQGAVNQCFLLSATGSGLDDQGAEWGLQRKQATSSYADLTITCYVNKNSPTIIPAESLFSTADGHQFATLSDATVTKQSNDSNNKPMVDKSGNPLGVATVQAVSTESGADENVAPHSIVNPVQTIDGFYSVDNQYSAQGGSEREGDVPFRRRIYNFRTAGPNWTDNGITAQLINLPDVQDTKIIDNNRFQPKDQYGNPWKSVHLYVLGGNDDEIAKTYFNCLYPTTHTVGSITKTVVSDDGVSHQISFDHAQGVSFYVHMILEVDSSKFNLDESPEDIKKNIENYFTSMNMGDIVRFSRLFAPAYQEPGVTDVRVELGTDKNNLDAKDVPLNEFERPEITDDDIQIDIVGGDSNV